MAKQPNIELTTLYKQLIDERFSLHSRISQLVSEDPVFFEGANAVKIFTLSTAPLVDYARHGDLGKSPYSRYGTPNDLDATTQTVLLTQDKAFTYVLDLLDVEQSSGIDMALSTSVGRQWAEVINPTAEMYVINKMIEGAGNKPEPITLTINNIYDEILKANKALDESLVPEEGRTLLVSTDTYELMKKSNDIVLNTDVGNEMRLKGVISNLDGLQVIKSPAVRLPEKFGFMVAYKGSTLFAQHLNSIQMHENPPGISGFLVEGRIVYDAFVFSNKKKGIYYQSII